MWRKLFSIIATLVFAFGILLISVFRTASVKYEFNPFNPSEKKTVLGVADTKVNYYLPYPGRILPDSPLWPAKALRDRLWVAVNTNPSREAELMLLLADKRIGSAVLLFQKGNTEVGLSTLTKGEKYLEEAARLEKINRQMGLKTDDLLENITKASLKHFEIIEYIRTIAPENARPTIIKAEEYSKNIYENGRNTLLDKKINPPENPFNW